MGKEKKEKEGNLIPVRQFSENCPICALTCDGCKYNKDSFSRMGYVMCMCPEDDGGG